MVQGFGKEIQPRVIFLKTEVWFSVKQNCERKIQWRIYNPGQKHWGSILKWTHFLPPPPDFNVATFWSIFSFAYDTASIISHGGMKQHWWRGERGRGGEGGKRGRGGEGREREERVIFPLSFFVRLVGSHLQRCPSHYWPGLWMSPRGPRAPSSGQQSYISWS